MAGPDPNGDVLPQASVTIDDLKARGVVLHGCGRMGQALLHGWLEHTFMPREVWVRDPAPSEALQGVSGLRLNEAMPADPALVVLAVKPQVMDEALDELKHFGGGGTAFLSVAAGITIERFEAALGPATPIVRAMPNTPAAIGRGITALAANAPGQGAIRLARSLCLAVGDVIVLEGEGQMDAVTALSGSGPAYVFHLIECLVDAGEAEGLPRDIALRLAVATVSGAGALIDETVEAPDALRRNVTSPGGTTEAALNVLMGDPGLRPLIGRTVAAAARRARELAN